MEHNKIKALFYLAELTSIFSKLTNKEIKEILDESIFQDFAKKWLGYQSNNITPKKAIQKQLSFEQNNTLSEYNFEVVMNNIRNHLAHKKLSAEDDLTSISWIIKLLLKNQSLFPKVMELDIFLSNVTGLKHSTKSTGRDRIVDWYLTKIDEKYPEEKINQIYFNILKYIFSTFSTDYKEWSKLLAKIN